MKEYIEREAVHSIIEQTSTFAFTRGGMHDKVNSLPAADVAPVRHGRWEFPIFADSDNELDPRVRCSECGEIEAAFAKWNYCPNCGALMDK